MSKDTKKTSDYKVLIPENVLPEFQKFERNPPNIPGFRISSFEQLVYLICKKKEDDGYSYLNMKILREQIPQAEYYVKVLSRPENPIIMRSNYVAGEHSYGYSFTPGYDSDYVIKPVTDMKLIQRLRNMPERFARGFSVQNKFVKNFTIDSQAWEYAKNNYSGDKLRYAQATITSMENPFERYSLIDDAGGRFYSNVTNCPKGLRQFIEVNGQFLADSIDVSNSQALISTMILEHPSEVAKFTRNRELASCLKNLRVRNSKDVSLYCDLVTAGEFYEYLIPKFEERGLIDASLNYKAKRDLVKKEVMKIFFDRNRSKLTKSKQLFKDNFPIVDEKFAIVRGDGRGERFPILLQALEAHIVLNKIYSVIVNDLKGVVFFTVHDSFLVSKESEAVKDIMADQLYKFTGFQPQIKIEKLSNQC